MANETTVGGRLGLWTAIGYSLGGKVWRGLEGLLRGLGWETKHAG